MVMISLEASYFAFAGKSSANSNELSPSNGQNGETTDDLFVHKLISCPCGSQKVLLANFFDL